MLLATKALAAAEAQPAEFRARAAAEQARWQSPPAADAQDLARQAARAERLTAVARADEELARAELELLKAAAAKKAEADKKCGAAREAWPGPGRRSRSRPRLYTPLRGALKTPESNLETERRADKAIPETSSGRRTALGPLADRRPPPADGARGGESRLGAPLRPAAGRTVFTSAQGGRADQPGVLDYLAVELVENGWGLKHLHRLIVTSQAYRRSSAGAASPNVAKDRRTLTPGG